MIVLAGFYLGIIVFCRDAMGYLSTWLMMTNGVLFTLAALSFTLMLSFILVGKRKGSENREILTAMSNVFGLSFSFLGGAFVPQWLIGNSLLKAASFTPTYWFVKTNDALTKAGWDPVKIGVNMGMLILFTIAFCLIAFVILKRKSSQQSLN